MASKLLFTNNAKTTSGAIASGATSITVADGSKFPVPGVNEYFLVTLFEVSGSVESRHEIVKVTNRTGNALTVVRDIESITGSGGGYAYAGTTQVELRWTAGACEKMLQSDAMNATGGAISGVAITGGTITGTPVAGSTGGFTTLAASGAFSLTGDQVQISEGGTGATTAPLARAALGLVIGTDVQAYDAELAALAGLTSAADKMPYFTGVGAASTATVTSFARTVLDDVDAATARATLGVAIGTNVQAYDAGLQSIAALTTVADQIAYTTASDTYATTALTAAGRALLDDANASAQRTTLGLGSIATQSAGAVTITGGTIEGTAIGAVTPAGGIFSSLGAASLTYTGAGDFVIKPSTADASDTGRIYISGGGAQSTTRGALLTVNGNESVTAPGCVVMMPGDTGNALVGVSTDNGVDKLQVSGSLLAAGVKNSGNYYGDGTAGITLYSGGTGDAYYSSIGGGSTAGNNGGLISAYGKNYATTSLRGGLRLASGALDSLGGAINTNAIYLYSEDAVGSDGLGNYAGRFQLTLSGAVRLISTSQGLNVLGDVKMTGNRFDKQPTPSAVNSSATLTIATMVKRLVTSAPAANITMTLPTGALTDAGVVMDVDQSFDWSIVNTGAFIVSVAPAATGHTVSGNLTSGNLTVAATSSATFRTRKTAADTFVTYRVS